LIDEASIFIDQMQTKKTLNLRQSTWQKNQTRSHHTAKQCSRIFSNWKKLWNRKWQNLWLINLKKNWFNRNRNRDQILSRQKNLSQSMQRHSQMQRKRLRHRENFKQQEKIQLLKKLAQTNQRIWHFRRHRLFERK
jgi:DNA polymerase III delta prime subunit